VARFRYSYVISGGSAEEISDRIDRLKRAKIQHRT
jgi:hypothetical protein